MDNEPGIGWFFVGLGIIVAFITVVVWGTLQLL